MQQIDPQKWVTHTLHAFEALKHPLSCVVVQRLEVQAAAIGMSLIAALLITDAWLGPQASLIAEALWPSASNKAVMVTACCP